MAVTAGRLEWDVDVKAADAVLRKVQELGRKMDEALNTRRGQGTGLSRVGEEAQQASNRVTRLANRFNELQGQFRSGRITLSQYQSGLNQLQQGIERTRNRVDLSARDWARLGTTMRNVQTAQATLGGSTAQINARVQSLVNEVRVLRNEWQRTGQHTEQTKARLNALQGEMRELSEELRRSEGGWERFNAQIARLGVAGRSAEATIAGIEGRISRLGLASQVNLAVQQQLIGGLYRFGPAGAVAGTSLGIVANQAEGMNLRMIGATAGILAVAGAAVGLTRRGLPEVQEFQRALRVMVADGNALTESDLDDTLRRIQVQAGAAGRQFSRSQLATAMSELVKAGVDASQAMDLLVPGMQLASVTGEDLNTTTTRLLTNLRQFRMDTSEAARMADVLAVADLNAAESAAELSEGLRIVGPVARAAGIELEDVTGILVELNNAGLSAADMAATALRSTLAQLLAPAGPALESLTELGVKLTDATGKARPLLDILKDLRTAMEGSGEAARRAAEIFDTRAIVAILNYSEKSDELAEALRNSTGAAREYADTFLDDNLLAAQHELNIAVSDLAKTFAGSFANDVAAVASALAGFLRQVDAWMSRFVEMDDVDIYESLFGTKFRPQDRARADELITTVKELDRQARALEEFLAGRPADLTGIRGLPAGPVTDANRSWVENLLARNREEAGELRQELLGLQQAGSEALDTVADAATKTGDAVGEVGKKTRTVEDVFNDLKDGLANADAIAEAFGDTTEATLDAAQAKTRLLRSAVTELITDFNFDPANSDIQAMIANLLVLEGRVASLRRLVSAPAPSLISIEGLVGEAPGLAGAPVTRPESEDELLKMLQDSDQNLADEVDRSIARQAALLANRHALVRSIVETQDLRREVFALGIDVTEALQDGTLEGLRNLEATIVKRLEDLGDDASGAPLMGLLVKVREAIANAEAEAAEAARQAALTAARQALVQARVARSAFRVEARNLGRDVGDAIAAGNLEALRALEENLVTLLQELGDDPSAAPLMGLLTAVRSEIRNVEADARSARLALDRLLLNTRTVQTRVARSLELRDLGKQITAAIQSGSLEALEELEAAIVARLQEMGDDPAAAPFLGLLTKVRIGILDVKAALDSFSRGPSAVAPGGRHIFNDFTTGAETAEERIRTLQARIQSLIARGFDPASDAVQRLVREINALQLKAALEELREGGFKGLSDFARKVLELNGILPKATDDVETFADKLAELGSATGNDIAAGLAKIVDGITQIAEAGSDAEEVVKGLTLALQGATQIVQALESGDAFTFARSAVGLVGEGIGMLTGIPGLGQLATAAFDFGAMIVQAISDAFTGDSPAARAIRESLTPAVAGAFATGIMNALRGQEDWREALEGNVKEAFLGALIQAFVQSAIIDAILAPIILQFSKLIAAGQYEEARAFLANELPAALNTAMTAIDVFLAGVPAGLLPGARGDSRGPTTPPPSTPGIHSLPTASVMAAPAWAGELSGAARNFNLAAHKFDEAVDRLVNEGVRVRQTNTSSGGSAAAARAA